MRPRTLNQTLGWLLASVIVPLILGALLLLYVQALQDQRAAQKQLVVLAQTLMQTVDRELAVGLEQLEVIAAAPMVNKRDWLSLQAFAMEVVKRRPGSVIGLVEQGGQQIFNTRSDLSKPQPNLWKLAENRAEATWEGYSLPVSSQLLTKKVFDSGKTNYSDLYYGMNTRKPALAISVPIKDAGEVRYALTLSFRPDRLQQLIDATVVESGLRVALIDRRGIVIASNAAAASKLGDRTTPFSGMTESAVGTFERTARDGTSVQGAYSVSPINGFVVRVARPSETFVDFVRSSTASWMALVLTAFLASVFLAGRAARRIGSPLRAMGNAVRLGQTEALPPTRIAELTVLTEALQSGARAEQHSRETLIVETQRSEALAALRRAAKEKDEFLATLAHELRNPLAPIRTATELIRRAAAGNDSVKRAADIIERQVGHMARMVDDLMDVSRISNGTVKLSIQPLDVVALTRNAADALRPSFSSAGLGLFEQPMAEGPIIVNGDAMRLTQCINNLFSNAIKFTPKGGTVVFGITQHEASAEIRVKDTGIGLEGKSLEKIFELFAQVRPSGSGGNTGLGIGLALTRKIVELHGGSVSASSEGSNCGSTFLIKLPLLEESISLPNEGSDIEVSYPPSVGTQILVVDDNIDAADLLAETLALYGFVTQVAYNGEMALRTAAQSPPSAVLLDIGLPDITGYEVAKQLRDLSPRIFLIALSGWGNDSDQQRSRESGFDAHLTKPAEIKIIVDLLTSMTCKS